MFKKRLYRFVQFSAVLFSSFQRKAGCVACKHHTWTAYEKWSHEYI